MSSSLKEIIIKFILVFIVLFLLGNFIPWLQINAIKAVAISAGISIVDTFALMFKKNKKA
ncbi:hypothetical protein CSC2_04600 [Clostridium zeae]|uniref:Phage holin n=1 Tax=Clostridium zeae TaxID=2759022 RepID=A0ABQ1E5C5_9CLOT|nr:hypothetical protein [Clostridium zeae]GFZ29934.1 hypothetical protein CSC2_04600 [Clostridium zeae]